MAAIYGEWWIDTRSRLPIPYEPPSHTVAGALYADDIDNWYLETIGSLTEQNFEFGAEHDEPEGAIAIWGTDAAGNRYSLLYPQSTPPAYASAHVRGGTQRWFTTSIVTGSPSKGAMWVTPLTEVNRVHMHFRDLETWMNDGTRARGYDWDTHKITVSTKQRSSVVAVNGGTLSAVQGIKTESRVDSAGEHLTVGPDSAFTVSEVQEIGDIYQEWVKPLGAMLSFFTMQSCDADNVQAELLNEAAEEDDDELWPVVLELRFPPELREFHEIEASRQDDTLSSHKALATKHTLSELGIEFGPLILGYFEAIQETKIRESLNYLLESQQKRSSTTFEDMFLLAFKGVELLHNHFCPTTSRIETTKMLDDYMHLCGDTAVLMKRAHPDLSTALNRARNDAAHSREHRPNAREQLMWLHITQWLLRDGLLRAIGLGNYAVRIITRHITYQHHVKQLGQYHQHHAQPESLP